MRTGLPQVALGKHRITRLIIGGNPFVGNSHYSTALSEEMREYYTDECIVKTLHAAQAAGINTVQTRGDFRMMRCIELFRREGGQIHWLVQNATEMHDTFQNIRTIAAAGAAGIYLHGVMTDNFYLDGKIDKVVDYLKAMRDAGVLVGLGTHIPEVIEYAEEKDWDIDFYMACLYNISTAGRKSAVMTGNFRYKEEPFQPEDPAKMCQTIRQARKMCLAFKIMGAGRRCGSPEEVHSAFKFAFDNIKATDAVVVGMFGKHSDQITENVKHLLEAGQDVPPI